MSLEIHIKWASTRYPIAPLGCTEDERNIQTWSWQVVLDYWPLINKTNWTLKLIIFNFLECTLFYAGQIWTTNIEAALNTLLELIEPFDKPGSTKISILVLIKNQRLEKNQVSRGGIRKLTIKMHRMLWFLLLFLFFLSFTQHMLFLLH